MAVVGAVSVLCGSSRGTVVVDEGLHDLFDIGAGVLQGEVFWRLFCGADWLLAERGYITA